MNALELADELEKVIDVRHYASEVLRKEVVKMLRQQQAEIEALKSRELTDEEIIKTMVQFDVYSNDDQCLIEAGRAILRKAQEK